MWSLAKTPRKGVRVLRSLLVLLCLNPWFPETSLSLFADFGACTGLLLKSGVGARALPSLLCKTATGVSLSGTSFFLFLPLGLPTKLRHSLWSAKPSLRRSVTCLTRATPVGVKRSSVGMFGPSKPLKPSLSPALPLALKLPRTFATRGNRCFAHLTPLRPGLAKLGFLSPTALVWLLVSLLQTLLRFRTSSTLLAMLGGAPGLDGWTHFELKWLSRHVPGLLQELFCILRDATFGTQSLSGPAWLTLLSWRLAAVPKREADEHRPVAVGSTILRVWQKTLLRLLPDLPSRQLGGRSGTSVSNTIGDWLSHRGLFGAEIDLAKAFDNVSWAAASASLRHQGVSPAIIRFLSHVWSGPRFCSLHGTLSSAFYGSRHSAG